MFFTCKISPKLARTQLMVIFARSGILMIGNHALYALKTSEVV